MVSQNARSAVNYRHRFHAGNFGDVFKHWLLLRLLAALTVKDRPLLYLETHAGEGIYPLARAGELGQEWREGIARLWDARDPALQSYLELVRRLGGEADDGPLAYPGSPRLAAACLRPRDRLILCELHPAAHHALHACFAGDGRVAVHRRDGYEALGALLPASPRRGLILIDPPYEARLAEFERIADGLERGLRRFPQGVYAIWYPIKTLPPLAPFARWLASHAPGAVLDLRLYVREPDSPLRLNGAGMAIVAPPFGFADGLASGLRLLVRRLAQGPGAAYEMRWLREP